jgi:Zn-dependent protease
LPPLEEVIPLFVILILSLSFHEAAHAWSADRLGDPTARMLGRLTLNPLAHIDFIGTILFPLLAMFSPVPLIGWAKPVPVNIQNFRSPLRDFAIVAVAGPVSNLVLATGLIVIFFLMHPGGADAYTFNRASQVLVGAIAMNVLLAVFNMLPVPPLDGGNVAIGLLPPPLANLLIRVRPWGFLVLYALLLSGVLDAIMRPISRLLQALLFA